MLCCDGVLGWYSISHRHTCVTLDGNGDDYEEDVHVIDDRKDYEPFPRKKVHSNIIVLDNPRNDPVQGEQSNELPRLSREATLDSLGDWDFVRVSLGLSQEEIDQARLRSQN